MGVDMARRTSTGGGMPWLIALAFQNSALILVMHYSRIMPPVNGERYYPSTAVFLNELVKLAISLTMSLYEVAMSPQTPQTATAAGIFGEVAGAVFTGDSWKLAIPAMLYTLQNSLQYVAVGHLDAATFQVTNQLKILTTAVFSVVLLRRHLSLRKWLSLLLLMAGVAVVSIPVGYSEEHVLSMKDLRDGAASYSPRNIWDLKALGNVAAGQLSKRSATYEGISEDVATQNPHTNPGLGLGVLVVACVLSGAAGVYFEKVLKESKSGRHASSVWVRNVQLSLYSLWPALFIGVVFKDGEHIAKTGFFAGYNWVVWLAVLLEAIGGILVALVIKHSDNIAKNFATSFSIIISFLVSIALFDFEITFLYILGASTVMAATYLYGTSDGGVAKGVRPPPISITDYEKSEGQGYFDLESRATAAKSPLRSNALSTSRPSTPVVERGLRSKSSGNISADKRS